MIKDITEMLKMFLIILLWLGAYSLSLELIKLYARSNQDINIEMKDFIPSVEDSEKSSYAHINNK